MILPLLIHHYFAPSLGIDHVTIAVQNLDQAAEKFRQLGFTLKPGQNHKNSIRNFHIKFGDGTSIELITATKPLDQTARRYTNLLKYREGAAFLALNINNQDRLKKTFLLSNIQLQNRVISAPKDLGYIFFWPGDQSVNDPRHILTHENGATGLQSVWINDQSPILQLLAINLGATTANPEVHSGKAGLFSFGSTSLLILDKPITHPAPIIGITVRTSELSSAKTRALDSGLTPKIETEKSFILQDIVGDTFIQFWSPKPFN